MIRVCGNIHNALDSYDDVGKDGIDLRRYHNGDSEGNDSDYKQCCEKSYEVVDHTSVFWIEVLYPVKSPKQFFRKHRPSELVQMLGGFKFFVLSRSRKAKCVFRNELKYM